MVNKIHKLADSIKNDAGKFLREIIAIPSMTGFEGDVVKRIKSEMDNLGYDELRIDKMGNILGRIGNGKNVIAIDGHCDTVSPGNLDNWKIDPFKGDMKDGNIYGRGATDQKGGVVSFLYSAKIIRELGIPDDITLWHVVSIQEEPYEGINWQYIIQEEGIKPDVVILTEPTNLDICRGHRGRIDIKIKTKGISCHGANPDLGVNAIYKMTPIVKEIESLQGNYPKVEPLGEASITITNICSEAPSMNAVADSAEISIDRRLTLGETMDSVLEEIKSLSSVKNENAEVYVPDYNVKSYKDFVYPIKGYYSSWLTDKDHRSVSNAEKTFKEIFDKEPITRVWNFSTNGVATMGLHGIPTIGFGPGDELLAHTVDEKVSIDDLGSAIKFYAQYIYSYSDK